MLNEKGFDLWSNEYEKSVKTSENNNIYPFAGYRNILNTIYNHILSQSGKEILDIGFGTGVLTKKLYEKGYMIYGQDFSSKMIELAKKKMPKAKLFQGDFSKSLVKELTQNKYDAIIATYSLHHLSDIQKIDFIGELLLLLKENGCIYIGDVIFKSREELEICKNQAQDKWDNDEKYFVFDELKEYFPEIKFKQISYCSGMLYLKK